MFGICFCVIKFNVRVNSWELVNANSDMKFLCTDGEDYIGSASITSFHEAKI